MMMKYGGGCTGAICPADVMPISNGVVLIGMGERTTRQAVYQVADQLLKQGAATRVIGCLMPKSRAAMHLDTVFSFCDRDLVTAFREVVDQIRCYSEHLSYCTDDGHLYDLMPIPFTGEAVRHVARRGDTVLCEADIRVGCVDAADFDQDGWLDLLVANQDGDANGLFRNDHGRFTDVAAVYGLAGAGRPVGARPT